MKTKSILVATARDDAPAAAAARLRQEIGDRPLTVLIVFFAPDYDAANLTEALRQAFGETPIIGCSTAGAVTPHGIQDDGIVAIGFPKSDFTAVVSPLHGLSSLGMLHAQGVARGALAELSERVSGFDPQSAFGLLLVDGLSNREEPLVSALYGGLDGLALLGGSAGDGLAFRRTHIIVDGRSESDAAVLVLIHSKRPFHVFRCDHFEATPIKLVVTKADVERRVVYELNANTAAIEYAAAVGLAGMELSPMSFAAHPVVVRVGGDYFVRSIQKVNPDGSLSFFCAIDEGIVLTVAKSRDMIATVESALDQARESIGEPEIVLGFECVLRRLEAEMYQVKHRVEDLYRRNRVVGFHTYGEQFRAMHLNQTFTGIAIGR